MSTLRLFYLKINIQGQGQNYIANPMMLVINTPKSLAQMLAI